MNIKETNWKIKLIRSTYAIDNFKVNELPQDMCSFVRMFVWSIILFPLAILSHLFNIIYREYEAKAWHGMVALFIGMAIVTACGSPGDQNSPPGFLHAWLTSFDGPVMILIIYGLAPLALVSLLIVIVVGILAVCAITWPFSKVKEYYDGKKKKSANTPAITWMPAYLKSIKDKYCIKINYIK